MSLRITKLSYKDDNNHIIEAKAGDGYNPVGEFVSALNNNKVVTCIGFYQDVEFMLLYMVDGKYMYMSDIRQKAKRAKKKTAIEAFEGVIKESELLLTEARLKHQIVTNGVQLDKNYQMYVDEGTNALEISQV